MAAFCVFSSVAMAGGSCGTNCQWDLTDGVLTITGTGENGTGTMTNYGNWLNVPWHDQLESITSIDISYGITNIGNNAFFNASNLVNISIPDSVTNIGWAALRGATSLTNITIPDSVTQIDGYAFNVATGLNGLKLPASVAYIGPGAFRDSGITEIYCTAAQMAEGGICNGTNNWGNYSNGDYLPFAGEFIHYEREGSHYNIYDEDGKLVAQYKNISDFDTENYMQKRTHYTLDLALDHIKKKRPGKKLNDITFTFK